MSTSNNIFLFFIEQDYKQNFSFNLFMVFKTKRHISSAHK